MSLQGNDSDILYKCEHTQTGYTIANIAKTYPCNLCSGSGSIPNYGQVVSSFPGVRACIDC
jgi:hypothetical protein